MFDISIVWQIFIFLHPFFITIFRISSYLLLLTSIFKCLSTIFSETFVTSFKCLSSMFVIIVYGNFCLIIRLFVINNFGNFCLVLYSKLFVVNIFWSLIFVCHHIGSSWLAWLPSCHQYFDKLLSDLPRW